VACPQRRFAGDWRHAEGITQSPGGSVVTKEKDSEVVDNVGRIILGVFVLLFAADLCIRISFSQRYKRHIRQWADENGYAVLQLAYRRPFHGMLVPFFNKGTWYVKIQDSQGGQAYAYIYFGHWLVDLPWGEMVVRWGG